MKFLNTRTGAILTLAALLSAFLIAGPSLAESASQSSAADSGATEAAVREVVNRGASAFNQEDVEGVMQQVHPASPKYADMRDRLNQTFKNADVNFKVVEFDFIGESGPYAFVRVTDNNRKIAGDFQDYTSDEVYIFRKQGNEWKYWGGYALETLVDAN